MKLPPDVKLEQIDERLAEIEEQLRKLQSSVDFGIKSIKDCVFEVAKTNVNQRSELIELHETHMIKYISAKLDELFPPTKPTKPRKLDPPF